MRHLRLARPRLVLELAAIAIAAFVAAVLGAGARGIVAAVAAAWLVATTLVRRFLPHRDKAAEPSSPADEAPLRLRLVDDVSLEPARDRLSEPNEEAQRWNVRDLERLAADNDDEELGYLVIYLRDVADVDGRLPLDYDPLVRDAFPAGATT